MKKKVIIIAAAVVILAAVAVTAFLICNRNKADELPSAVILNELSVRSFDVTFEVSLKNAEFADSIVKDGIILDGAFRNLAVVGAERKDAATVLIHTSGMMNSDYSVGSVTLPPELTSCGEAVTAKAEVNMAGGTRPVLGIGLDYDKLSKMGLKALVTAGVGKIPYVGAAASKALGPILSDALGLKRDASLEEIMKELEAIKAQLSDISEKIDASTQSILNRMFISNSFDYFDESVSDISTITDSLYGDIARISGISSLTSDTTGEVLDARSLEDYKTFKTAELLDFDSRNISDYVNSVKTIIKYLDGSQTSMTLKNNKGIFENAFLAGCDGSVLGGEAAMRVGPYLNQVSGTLSDSLRGMIIVLESKLYISENFREIKEYAASHSNDSLLRLLDASAEKEYLDPDNKLSWRGMLSESDDASIIALHNHYFGDEDSAIASYNKMVQKHWFSFIRSYSVSDTDISVGFADLSRKIISVKPTEIGLNWNAAKANTEYCVDEVNGKLSDELHVAVSKDEIVKIISHIIKNENNVFLSSEPDDGIISVDDQLLDMLTSFGFELDRFENIKSLFICSSSGKYTKTPIYDVSPMSRHIGDDYFATLSVRGYDCADVHGYNTETGLSYSDAVWKDYKYYDYYYKFMTGKTEKSKQEDYVFYYFAPADIEITDKSDLISFMDSVASGSTYEGKTVNITADIDMTGESYAHIWDGSRNKSEFKGTLNGGGHSIIGLTNNTSGSYGGLFSVLGEGAKISDLKLVDFKINGTGSNTGFGALAGSVNGYVRITNVDTVGGSVSGHSCVGGIVGEIRSGTLVISGCENTAAITARGAYAGGIVGGSTSKKSQDISGCVNSADVTAPSAKAAGGIVGYLANDSSDQAHTVSMNGNSGSVSAGSGYAGGIIGHLDSDSVNHKITNNENSGAVTSDASDAGGIVGYSEGGGSFKNNRNSGKISGKNAGGILGANEDDRADFSRSRNEGAVTGTTNAGGIAGYLGNNDLDNPYTADGCTNSGTISSDVHSGGLVGHLDTDSKNHVFTNNVNTADITSASDSGGIIGYSEGGGSFTGNSNSGVISGKQCGGIVGANEDDRIDFSRSVNSGEIKAESHAGGILGFTGSRSVDDPFVFDYCENTAKVTSVSGHAGGIAGNVTSDSHGHSFIGCTNTAEITGGISTGGIIGKMEGGASFKDCTNDGKVVSKTKCAAGICGYVVDDGCTFTGCTNTASVSGVESSGGIAGEIGNKDNDPANKFIDCENSGSVVSSGMNAGGICGMLKTDSSGHKIEECKNSGSVSGKTTAGGMIGFIYGGGAFVNCENSASVTTGNDYAGGMVGRIEDDSCSFTDCVNSGEISGTGSHIGQTCGYDGKKKTTY